ncbi:phosphoribosylformylglycinamidine synthase subunit PurS [Ignicoccus islandicus]|nr:phosphoribosylformylglycinamidine synthase subunit PurS [Ignicoccus islandicus]
MEYQVEVIIRNKKVARDPEAETIFNELVSRSNLGKDVTSLRTGKWFLFNVVADSEESAIEKVTRLCKELRIFNPVIHEMEVRLYKSSSTQISGY